MSPWEHYQEAERLLEDAALVEVHGRNALGKATTVEQLTARAHVHAQLASVPYSPPVTPRSTP